MGQLELTAGRYRSLRLGAPEFDTFSPVLA